jgi:hypothetical protein
VSVICYELGYIEKLIHDLKNDRQILAIIDKRIADTIDDLNLLIENSQEEK